jgi:hypothetical protein
MKLSLILSIAFHVVYILAMVYILQEVLPNSTVLRRIFPKKAMLIFRTLIGFSIILCAFVALDKEVVSHIEILFTATLAGIAMMAAVYGSCLERILEVGFTDNDKDFKWINFTIKGAVKAPIAEEQKQA